MSEARRADAESHLGAALSARNAAILAGRKPDLEAVALAEATVAAIDADELERIRSGREAAARAAQKRRAGFCAAMVAAEGRRGAAIEAAEKHARSMAAALHQIVAADAEIRAASSGLGVAPPWAIERTVDDLSERLTAILRGIGRTNELGIYIKLRAALLPPAEPWLAANRTATAAAIAAIVAKEKA